MPRYYHYDKPGQSSRECRTRIQDKQGTGASQRLTAPAVNSRGPHGKDERSKRVSVCRSNNQRSSTILLRSASRKVEYRSQFDLVLDRGASEYVVNDISHFREVENTPEITVELAEGRTIRYSQRGLIVLKIGWM